MNSSFGTTVARHRRPHFGHCLASGPLADQLCTSKFGEREILTAIYWGLLKQPDNQKITSSWRRRQPVKAVQAGTGGSPRRSTRLGRSSLAVLSIRGPGNRRFVA